MSARERFFKKVQQNKLPAPNGDNPVAADIQRFCRQMNELAQQVCQWLDGSGVEIIISTTYLSDLSTVGASLNSGASRYEITTILLQNGNRSVSILPEQLYQAGNKGCVTLMANVPELTADKQHFYLHMAADDGWFIRDNTQPTNVNIPLTETGFFRAIDILA